MASGPRPKGLAIIQLRQDIGWHKFGASERENVPARVRQRRFAADKSPRAGRANGFADLVHTKRTMPHRSFGIMRSISGDQGTRHAQRQIYITSTCLLELGFVQESVANAPSCAMRPKASDTALKTDHGWSIRTNPPIPKAAAADLSVLKRHPAICICTDRVHSILVDYFVFGD
jgi:hypothetical protein